MNIVCVTCIYTEINANFINKRTPTPYKKDDPNVGTKNIKSRKWTKLKSYFEFHSTTIFVNTRKRLTAYWTGELWHVYVTRRVSGDGGMIIWYWQYLIAVFRYLVITCNWLEIVMFDHEYTGYLFCYLTTMVLK